MQITGMISSLQEEDRVSLTLSPEVIIRNQTTGDDQETGSHSSVKAWPNVDIADVAAVAIQSTMLKVHSRADFTVRQSYNATNLNDPFLDRSYCFL